MCLLVIVTQPSAEHAEIFQHSATDQQPQPEGSRDVGIPR